MAVAVGGCADDREAVVLRGRSDSDGAVGVLRAANSTSGARALVLDGARTAVINSLHSTQQDQPSITQTQTQTSEPMQ